MNYREEYTELILGAGDGEYSKELLIEVVGRLHKIISEKNIHHLYKYCRGEHYDFVNLEANQMTTRQPKEFNDPYEFGFMLDENDYPLLSPETKIFVDKDPDFYGRENIQKAIKQEIYMEIHTSAKPFIEDWYVLCLSETVESILMWSHYAQDHKGMCIEYDVYEILDLMKDQMFIAPVKYEENVPSMSLYPKVSQMLNVMYTKNTDWSYEKEWRIISSPENTKIKHENDLSFIKMPEPTSIYLGCKVDDKVKQRAIEYSEEHKNVKLCYMDKSLKEYRLMKK